VTCSQLFITFCQKIAGDWSFHQRAISSSWQVDKMTAHQFFIISGTEISAEPVLRSFLQTNVKMGTQLKKTC